MSRGKKIAHGLAGTIRQSEERRSFSSRPTTTTTGAPSNVPESSFEEPAGLVEDYFYFSEEQEEPSDPFSQDPSSFLFIPGIQESRKGVEEVSSESNNFGLDTSPRREEEFGKKIDSEVEQQSRFQPQGLNSPGITFNEAGESNLFDVLSQLDL